MKNILVPVGSSKNSVSNLQYAIDLAKETHAKVFVVAVFQELSKVGNMNKVNAIMKEDTRNRLEEILAQVDKKGVSVVLHPIKGGIIDGIQNFNSQIPIDLMVLAPRSNSISEEVYLGHTSGKLLKGTNIPILVVPEGMKFEKPKTMLMAFKNGSFSPDKVLDPVREFINNFGTKVNVLHVKTPETTEEMAKLTDNLTQLQTKNETVESATTFQAVLEHFHLHNPDMLCVVRRKRGFFKRLWEKNTILKREFHTSKPLLVLQVQE
ncbi:MAG TPA: universal stress protein [Salinimicrobium sp.]|nr:universal stress protein [Salinimicrobium sp.]